MRIFVMLAVLCITNLGCTSVLKKSSNDDSPLPNKGKTPGGVAAASQQTDRADGEPSAVAASIAKTCKMQFPSVEIQDKKHVPNLIGVYEVVGKNPNSEYILLDFRGYFTYYKRDDKHLAAIQWDLAGWLADFDGITLVDAFSYVGNELSIDLGGKLKFKASRIADTNSLPKDMRALLAIHTEACSFYDQVAAAGIKVSITHLGLEEYFFTLVEAYRYLDIVQKFNADPKASLAMLQTRKISQVRFRVSETTVRFCCTHKDQSMYPMIYLDIGGGATDKDGHLLDHIKDNTLFIDPDPTE